MRHYALIVFVFLAAALAAFLAAALRRRNGERPRPPCEIRKLQPDADRPRPAGAEREGDVHEVKVPSQDRQQGYKRLFYILGRPGEAAVRLHVWCGWENRSELLGFQIVTGIDSGIAINWQGGSAQDQFSVTQWSEDSYVFHPVSFSGNAGSAEELRRCAEVLRASRLDRTIVEPVASVLESRIKHTGAR